MDSPTFDTLKPPPRRWQPTPALRASAWLHAAAAGAAVVHPAGWPWAIGAVVADHLALTAAGLWPRSRALGPNLDRLPIPSAMRREIALTFDDGPDPDVTPQVLDALDAHGVRATFFVIGTRARAQAALCREIARRGHAVQNHTEHHHHTFAFLGPRRFAREIGAAQTTLADITGVWPTFFRAPAGVRNPLLEPVLADLGLRLTSWTRRGFDTVERDAATVVRRLDPAIAPGGIALMHDGHAARTRDGTPVVLAALPALLARVRERALVPVTLPDAMR